MQVGSARNTREGRCDAVWCATFIAFPPPCLFHARRGRVCNWPLGSRQTESRFTAAISHNVVQDGAFKWNFQRFTATFSVAQSSRYTAAGVVYLESMHARKTVKFSQLESFRLAGDHQVACALLFCALSWAFDGEIWVPGPA